MQKQVIIALAIVGTLTAGFFLLRSKPTQPAQTDALREVYNQWKANYNIKVGAGEDELRFKVFSSNYAKINTHNRLLGRSYTLGLNPFTHMTQEEFAATKLGLKKPVARNTTAKGGKSSGFADHTDKMNAVRDQGQCGSCWAFSAVGALEGFHSVVNKNLFQLSEQELVDCSGSYGNEGCNGGLMDSAFKYVIDNKEGLADRTKDYPYKAVDGTCKTGLKRQGAIGGFVDVPVNDPEALKLALDTQPVAVAIEADTFTFQFYSSGVLSGSACGTNLDHGVVAVGYDTTLKTEKKPFYNVRNSWGSSWGNKGHVKIGIEDGAGVCGIQMAASYPTA